MASDRSREPGAQGTSTPTALGSSVDRSTHDRNSGWTEDVRVDAERRREAIAEDWQMLHGRTEESDVATGYTHVDRRSAAERAVEHEPAERTSRVRGAQRAGRRAVERLRETGGDGMAGALLRGAVAGAVGALAMSLTHRVSSKVLLGSTDAAPNPANTAAEQLADRAGAELSERQADAGGTALMMGYGALLGAVYGAVHSRVQPPAVLHALLLSGVSYAVTTPGSGLLPKLGLVAPPTEQTLLAAMVPMDAHVAYGVTTAATFEALS